MVLSETPNNLSAAFTPLIKDVSMSFNLIIDTVPASLNEEMKLTNSCSHCPMTARVTFTTDRGLALQTEVKVDWLLHVCPDQWHF